MYVCTLLSDGSSLVPGINHYRRLPLRWRLPPPSPLRSFARASQRGKPSVRPPLREISNRFEEGCGSILYNPLVGVSGAVTPLVQALLSSIHRSRAHGIQSAGSSGGTCARAPDPAVHAPQKGHNPTNIISAPLPRRPTAFSFSGFGIVPHAFTSSVLPGIDTGRIFCLGSLHRTLSGSRCGVRSTALYFHQAAALIRSSLSTGKKQTHGRCSVRGFVWRYAYIIPLSGVIPYQVPSRCISWYLHPSTDFTFRQSGTFVR